MSQESTKPTQPEESKVGIGAYISLIFAMVFFSGLLGKRMVVCF